MKDLIEFIAKSLVRHPDQVRVSQVEGERNVIYELQVAPEDVGKVIGKQGRIAKAMRTVVRSAAGRDSRAVYVEIIE